MSYPTYFDTTDERGATLDRYESKAKGQDEIILQFFRSHQGQYFSASQVWKACFGSNTPLTSIRRSITGLEKSGTLKKLSIKITGQYGRPEYVHTLPLKSQQLKLF